MAKLTFGVGDYTVHVSDTGDEPDLLIYETNATDGSVCLSWSEYQRIGTEMERLWFAPDRHES